MRGNGSRFKRLLKARETWGVTYIRSSFMESGKEADNGFIFDSSFTYNNIFLFVFGSSLFL